MARLTAAEYGKFHGAKAGRQLARERSAARARLNPFARDLGGLTPAPAKPVRRSQPAQARPTGRMPTAFSTNTFGMVPVLRNRTSTRLPNGTNPIPLKTLVDWHFDSPRGRKDYFRAYKALPDVPTGRDQRGFTKIDALADAVNNPELRRSRDVLLDHYKQYSNGKTPSYKDVVSAAQSTVEHFQNPAYSRPMTKLEAQRHGRGINFTESLFNKVLGSGMGTNLRNNINIGRTYGENFDRSAQEGLQTGLTKVGDRADRIRAVAVRKLRSDAEKNRRGGGALPIATANTGTAIAGLESSVADALDSKLGKSAFKDATQLVPATPLFAYQLARDFNRDPVEAVKKDIVDPTWDVLKDPKKSFQERPVSTALIFSGLYGAAGRAAGGAARIATAGKVASTARPFLVNPKTGVVKPREYSPNLINQIVQRAKDKSTTKIVDKGPTLGEAYANAGVELPKGLNPKRRNPGQMFAEPRIGSGNKSMFKREAKRQANEEADVSKLDKQEGRGLGRESRPGSSEIKRKVGPTITYLDESNRTIKGEFPYDTQVRTSYGEALPHTIHLPDGTDISARRILSIKEPRVKAALDRGKSSLSSVSKYSKKVENDIVGLYNSGSIGRHNDLLTELKNERKRIVDGQDKTTDVKNGGSQANRDNLRVVDAAISKASRGSLDVDYVLGRVRQQAHKQNMAESAAKDLPALNEDAAIRRPLLEAGLRRGLIERNAENKFVEADGRGGFDGESVSNERLRQILEEDGVDLGDISYISARPDKGGFGDYWQRDTRDRGSYQTSSYSGQSTLRRESRSDAQALEDQNVRIRVVSAAIRASDRFRRSHALTDDMVKRVAPPRFYEQLKREGYKEDGVLTARQAQDIIEHAETMGIELGAMRVISRADMKRFNTDAAEMLQRDSEPAMTEIDVESSLMESLFGQDVKSSPFSTNIKLQPQAGLKNVVLVPGEALKVFLEHNTMGPGGMPVIGAAFRRAVLPFSARWFGGNIVEGEMRKMLAGVVPVFDILRSRIDAKSMNALRAASPETYDLIRFSTSGGRMFGSQLHNTVRTPSGLRAQNKGEFTVPLFEKDVKSPLVKATYNGIRTPLVKLSDASFKLNDIYESLNERQVRGKRWSKELRDFTGSWRQSLKVQEDTILAIAKHWESNPKLAQAKAVQFGRYVDQTLGKYSKFSPPMRRFIQGYAPFVAWYLNSVKFFTYLLPVKHPVITGALAATSTVLDPDIKDWMAGNGPSQAIGSGRYGIDLGDGDVLDVGHVTPAGAFQSGVAKGAAGQLVPQLDSVISIAEGKNPISGRQLTDENGEPITDQATILALCINSLLLSTVPGASVYQRISEGGRSGAGNSTIWSPKANQNAYDKGLWWKMLAPINKIHYGGAQSAGSGGFGSGEFGGGGFKGTGF